jgi:hypothetical protein
MVRLARVLKDIDAPPPSLDEELEDLLDRGGNVNAHAHCWRVRYPTERAALLAVIVHLANTRQPTAARPYECERCGKWHIEGGSMVERSEVEYATAAPGERRKTVKGTKEAVRLTVVAITSGAAEVKGIGAIVFHEGEVFAADHPLVKQCPMFFVPSNSTTAEIHAAKVATGNYR